MLAMGMYMKVRKGTEPPVILTPRDLNPGLVAEAENKTIFKHIAAFPSFLKHVSPKSAPRTVTLFQVLAPCLVARGRLFGSKLALEEEWMAIDQPYFSATGEQMTCDGK